MVEYYKKEGRIHNTVHWHTYEPSIIKNGGWALDLGCNDFIFSTHLISLGLNVIALDPIESINIPGNLINNPKFHYIKKACIGEKKEEKVIYYEYQAWGANSVYNPPEMLHRPENAGHANNPFKKKYEVQTTTIQEIMNDFGIDVFEIIKIDVEGAEYDILEHLPKKCSKQLNIEFHAFLGLTPIEDVEKYHKDLIEKLEDYFISYEQLEPLRNNPKHSQRDDSLYVLKDLL